MKEETVIAETDQPVTVETLSRDLQELGVHRGDILLVHSSLSSLGWVCGGPQAVITALMNVVGSGGTLVMPAHSGDWSDPAEWEHPPVPESWFRTIYDHMPAFDPGRTPTRGMGRIAELLRTFPRVMRSCHPQVSFSAFGKHAETITAEHPLTPQFGEKSPLGRMYQLGAKVLLLGVGYDSCTSFHLAESRIGEMPRKRLGAAILENGERVWKWFDDCDYDSDDFAQIGPEFEKTRHVQKGKVGNADSVLFDMRDGVDFTESWLREHRFYGK